MLYNEADTEWKGRLPLYKNLCDLHSHSDCSFDGTLPAREMCRRAEALGLKYYALTDHCECDQYDGAPEFGGRKYRDAVRRAWTEMETLQAEFPGIRFLKGIEIGQPIQAPDAAEDALSGRGYDIVIGSVHGTRGKPDFYHLAKALKTEDEKNAALARYFEDLMDTIAWGKFDTLAHITYPLRYGYPAGSHPTFDRFQKELDAVLTALIESGKALEFNTSRLLKTDGPVLPDREVYSRYYALGGRRVTLGADAHGANGIAKGVPEAMDLLREIGFTEYTVFIGREPHSVPLA